MLNTWQTLSLGSSHLTQIHVLASNIIRFPTICHFLGLHSARGEEKGHIFLPCQGSKVTSWYLRKRIESVIAQNMQEILKKKAKINHEGHLAVKSVTIVSWLRLRTTLATRGRYSGLAAIQSFRSLVKSHTIEALCVHSFRSAFCLCLTPLFLVGSYWPADPVRPSSLQVHGFKTDFDIRGHRPSNPHTLPDCTILIRLLTMLTRV